MIGDDQRTAMTPADATDDLQIGEQDEDDQDLEFCGECGDAFRYDDCGGYNPPCDCGFACRSCCEHGRPQFCAKDRVDEDDDGQDYRDEDDAA